MNFQSTHHITTLIARLLLSLAVMSHACVAFSQTTSPALSTKPEWVELTELQKQALLPLEQLWSSMTIPHKRKWLAISHNFSQLSADEQSTVQSRMRDWASLSPQQRAAARLNFANSKELLLEDKKAKWEAYQALPPEAKQKLATQQQSKPPAGAATAVKPIAPQKLATPPAASENKPLPRIASDKASPSTLLPNALNANIAPSSVTTETTNPPQ